MGSIRDRCPTCGFDPATVSPSDAALAARTLPRRFRAVLFRPDDDVEPEKLLRARGHADQATEAMAAAALAIRPGRAVDRGDVADAATALADAIDRLSPEEWADPHGAAGREGVHMGVHHLRLAQQVMDGFPA